MEEFPTRRGSVRDAVIHRRGDEIGVTVADDGAEQVSALHSALSSMEVAVAGLTEEEVGLGLVDNTADAAKPVSGPQAQTIADAALRGMALVRAGGPIAADLTAGRYAIALSAAADRPSLCVNIGGTVYDLLNAPAF